MPKAPESTVATPVKAGFPNPAAEANLSGLNLHELVVQRPASTFFMRLSVDQPALGLQTGDLLVVDRSLAPRPGSLIIGVKNGQLVVGQFQVNKPQTTEVELWGIVTHSLRTHGQKGRAR